MGVINRVTPHHHSTDGKFLFCYCEMYFCIVAFSVAVTFSSAFELSFTEAAEINPRMKGENFGAPGLRTTAELQDKLSFFFLD